MIIDLILDRKGGTVHRVENGKLVACEYEPRTFYNSLREYESVGGEIGGVGSAIIDAMEEGEEADVKKALCAYVEENGYPVDVICDYINSVNWL